MRVKDLAVALVIVKLFKKMSSVCGKEKSPTIVLKQQLQKRNNKNHKATYKHHKGRTTNDEEEIFYYIAFVDCCVPADCFLLLCRCANSALAYTFRK